MTRALLPAAGRLAPPLALALALALCATVPPAPPVAAQPAALAAVSTLAPVEARRPAPRPLVTAPAPRAPDPIAVTTARVPVPLDPGARGRVLAALDVAAEHPLWGGLSGVEIAPDGARAYFLSDRGALFEARLLRDEGVLTGLADLRALPLRDPRDRTLRAHEGDSEGLAKAPDGGLLVCFEGDDRVWRYDRPGGAARALPEDPDFGRHTINEGLEALAVAADGTVIALREAPEPDGGFRLYRLAPGAREWTRATVSLDGPHRPTGAAFGPDGALWLLRRDFGLLSGFRARLDRLAADTTGGWRAAPVLAISAAPRENFEGVSLWRAPDGALRALLVTDDNFNALQRTLLVEIELDPPAQPSP